MSIIITTNIIRIFYIYLPNSLCISCFGLPRACTVWFLYMPAVVLVDLTCEILFLGLLLRSVPIRVLLSWYLLFLSGYTYFTTTR